MGMNVAKNAGLHAKNISRPDPSHLAKKDVVGRFKAAVATSQKSHSKDFIATPPRRYPLSSSFQFVLLSHPQSHLRLHCLLCFLFWFVFYWSLISCVHPITLVVIYNSQWGSLILSRAPTATRSGLRRRRWRLCRSPVDKKGPSRMRAMTCIVA